MEYYTTNIQLDKNVIEDVFKQLSPTSKLLVFGLGYDSKMWYLGNNTNTYFIEDQQEYIDMNKDIIESSHIIHYIYPTTVKTSFALTDTEIANYTVPQELLQQAPFDVIIIDGPRGGKPFHPGRIIPCYWSATQLSKPGTVIYIDDSKRPLEKYCIEKFFNLKEKILFHQREESTKLLI